ncbi:MAG: 50S ribosomal protein L25 [Chitinophagales bacterium]|nr:50S ribosomal protein L25 [Bacteroidota bacterium]
MRTLTLAATKRDQIGSNAAKKTRNQNEIPCVLYGGKENLHLAVGAQELHNIVYNPDFYLTEVQVDGNNHTCIIKAVQFDPVTDSILHVDFLELTAGKKVVLEIPLKFNGPSVGEKAGGKLITQMRKLKVKTLPKHIVSEIDVDIKDLDLGKSIKVSQLSLENMEIINALSTPMATIEIPRSLKSANAAK